MDEAQATRMVASLAAAQELPIPEPCRTGVARNLAVLMRHARLVMAAAQDAPADPAELLRP